MAEPSPADGEQVGNTTAAKNGDVISISRNIVNSTIIIKSIVTDDHVFVQRVGADHL